MTYRIAKTGSVIIDGVERGKPKVFRHNDGAITIMKGEEDDEDNRAVLHVLMTVRPKRGEAWKTEDPEQEAFAQRVVDLLNAAEVGR